MCETCNPPRPLASATSEMEKQALRRALCDRLGKSHLYKNQRGDWVYMPAPGLRTDSTMGEWLYRQTRYLNRLSGRILRPFEKQWPKPPRSERVGRVLGTDPDVSGVFTDIQGVKWIREDVANTHAHMRAVRTLEINRPSVVDVAVVAACGGVLGAIAGYLLRGALV